MLGLAALRAREAGRDGRRLRHRGEIRPVPERRLRSRAPARRLARPRRRPARAQPPRAALPTLQLTIDARVQRAADKAILARPRARARERPRRRAGRSRRRHEPVDRRRLCARELSDVQPGRGGARPEVPREPLQGPGPNPRLLNQATQGLYPTGSTFKPIVAEAALSGGLDHAVDAAALQRLVHARRLHVPQRRGRRLLEHVAADRARGVVRHVVLPARRPVLPRGSQGASSAGRSGSASGTRRGFDVPGEAPGSSRRPRGCERPTTSRGTRGRRSTSRSGRATSR